VHRRVLGVAHDLGRRIRGGARHELGALVGAERRELVAVQPGGDRAVASTIAGANTSPGNTLRRARPRCTATAAWPRRMPERGERDVLRAARGRVVRHRDVVARIDRFERHAADRAVAGVRRGDLAVHRTDVAPRRRHGAAAADHDGRHDSTGRERDERDAEHDDERRRPYRRAGLGEHPARLPADEIRAHHLVVLVIEDVAVPHVARAAGGRSNGNRLTPADTLFTAVVVGAQRIATRVTWNGRIFRVSFQPPS